MQQAAAAISGVSAGLRGVEDEVLQTRHSDSGVLLTGEDGVGKTLIARLIHDHSSRAAGPFVVASCANLPEDVLDCRMFGAEYGDARPACQGGESWLEQAHGGTLLLDDVDAIGLRAQGTLLRFLDTGQHQRVAPGRQPDRRWSLLDVRVIAATRCDLLSAVRDGRFSEHLYYRLNVIHIPIPALRERRDDVPVLMQHFLQRACANGRACAVPEPTSGALDALMDYEWPGNVDELETVAGWLVLRGETAIDARMVRAAIKALRGDDERLTAGPPKRQRDMEASRRRMARAPQTPGTTPRSRRATA